MKGKQYGKLDNLIKQANLVWKSGNPVSLFLSGLESNTDLLVGQIFKNEQGYFGVIPTDEKLGLGLFKEEMTDLEQLKTKMESYVRQSITKERLP